MQVENCGTEVSNKYRKEGQQVSSRIAGLDVRRSGFSSAEFLMVLCWSGEHPNEDV